MSLEQNGSNVDGWPYYSDAQSFGTGTLADLDEDGDTDIVFQGYDAMIHVFDTAGKLDYKRIECGTWLYDNWHTGAYHRDLYREAESANSMISFETVAGSPGPWVWFEMGRLPLEAGVHDIRIRAPKLPIVIDRWMLTTRTRFPLLDERPHAW